MILVPSFCICLNVTLALPLNNGNISPVNAFVCFLCTVTTLKCCFHRVYILFYEFCIKTWEESTNAACFSYSSLASGARWQIQTTRNLQKNRTRGRSVCRVLSQLSLNPMKTWPLLLCVWFSIVNWVKQSPQNISGCFLEQNLRTLLQVRDQIHLIKQWWNWAQICGSWEENMKAANIKAVNIKAPFLSIIPEPEPDPELCCLR